jgi:hypothetical protein
MTDPELPADPRVENALLRVALSATARALKSYFDAPHVELDDDGVPKLEVIVPEDTREKASDALAKAQKLLQESEKGIVR